MDEVKEVIEFIKSAPHRLKTKIGGLIGALVLYCLLYEIRFVPTEINEFLAFGFSDQVLLIGWFTIIPALTLAWWWIWSGRSNLFCKKKLVVFCIARSNARLHDYYTQSLDLVKSFIADCGLSAQIEIKDIGSDIIVSDESASQYIRKNKALVVLHGTLFLDRDDGNFIHHYRFRVTWKTPPNIAARIQQLVAADGTLFCSNRNWDIREIDSKQDQEKVAGAFSEIILFLVAVSQLTVRNGAEQTINILLRLRNLLNTRNAGISVTFTTGEKVSPQGLSLLRQGRVNALLQDLYLDHAVLRIGERNFDDARALLQAASVIPNSKEKQIGILVPLAYCLYHLSDISSAKQVSSQIIELDPKNPNAYVNLGFLEIVNKDYAKAAVYYKKFIFGSYDCPHLVTQVVEFLGERIIEMPQESALKFASGAVNFAYLDESKGRSELEEFIADTKGTSHYQPLSALAENLIKRGVEGTKRYIDRQQRRRRSRSNRKTRTRPPRFAGNQ